MTRLPITNRDARRLLIAGQGLAAPRRRRLTRAGLLGMIDALGYVQVDSINTVERAHHMILFARNQTYRPAQLAHLLERQRSLFENWTHDAAVIPTRFYPYWQARFVRERESLLARWRNWRREGFEDGMEDVLARVRDGGPVMARELGSGEAKNAQSWWDWHPSKTALEFLWRTGSLAVCRREGFQKVYDLAERVIPHQHLGSPPDDAGLVDWACRAALDRLGFATPGALADFWGKLSAAEAAAWCESRLGEAVIEAEIQTVAGGRPQPVYAVADIEGRIAALPPVPGGIRVLSPFDPLIRDRQRTERLFGFRYRIEVFVPEARRQFGYYVFPLLEKDRFVGRVDMKRGPGGGNLEVTGLWLEPGLKLTPRRRAGLEDELGRLAGFVGAGAVRFADGFVKEPPRSAH